MVDWPWPVSLYRDMVHMHKGQSLFPKHQQSVLSMREFEGRKADGWPVMINWDPFKPF